MRERSGVPLIGDMSVEQSNQNRQGFKKKARVLKSPTKCAVPHSFPKWAVDTSSHVESPHVRSKSLQPLRLSTSHPPPSPSPSQLSKSSSSLSSFSSSDSEIED